MFDSNTSNDIQSSNLNSANNFEKENKVSCNKNDNLSSNLLNNSDDKHLSKDNNSNNVGNSNDNMRNFDCSENSLNNTNEKNLYCDFCIIGAGPAGLTASIYAARAAKNVVVFSGSTPFGQLMNTYDVENYPGFATPIQGPQLMKDMAEQAKCVGVQIIAKQVDKIDILKKKSQKTESSDEEYKFCILYGKSKCYSKICIVTTGATPKWLGLKSEERLKGRGVSSCATCDGAFFKNLTVVVVGGGNTAVEEAIYLSNIAKKVILVHRRNTLRAEAILQKKLFALNNVEFYWNFTLSDIFDDGSFVNEVEIENVQNMKKQRIAADGVFIAIGHAPQTSLVKEILTLDEYGYVKGGQVKTHIDGLYVAGDVVDSVYRQAVTAAAQGCMAAIDALKFLSINEI